MEMPTCKVTFQTLFLSLSVQVLSTCGGLGLLGLQVVVKVGDFLVGVTSP